MKNTKILHISLKIVLVFVLLFSACNMQQDAENKSDTIKNGQEQTFEQKQQKHRKTDDKPLFKVPEALDFRYAAKRVTPSVVHIRSIAKSGTTSHNNQQLPEWFKYFFGEEYRVPRQQRPSAATGSGVIISNDGYIVTNNHVVAHATDIEVILSDNRSYKAAIIGTDPSTDLALLKIEETELEFLEFGNSDTIEIGSWVLAVGNPFNLSSTVTAGIVSAKARNINILREQASIESFIQTDAAVNPGNSGGALVDINGKLIGINTAIATPTGTYAGYSFAIPVDIVKKVANDLINFGIVQRAYLGVYIQDMNAELAEELDIDITQGVYISEVIEGSAADKANLKSGDIIIRIGDKDVKSVPELQEIIGRRKPGDEVTVTYLHNGEQKQIAVILQNEQGTTKVVRKETTNMLKILGIQVTEITDEEKKDLELTNGIKVTRITDGKIAKTTNMKEGFIITKLNNKRIHTIDEFIKELEDKKGGIMLEGIYPGNSEVYYYAFGL